MKTYKINKDNTHEMGVAIIGFIADMNSKISMMQELLDKSDDGPLGDTKQSAGVEIQLRDDDEKREVHLSLSFNVAIKEVPYVEDRP